MLKKVWELGGWKSFFKSTSV